MVEYLHKLKSKNKYSVIHLKKAAWNNALAETSQYVVDYLNDHPDVHYYVFTDPDIALIRTAPDILLFYAGILSSCSDIRTIGPALQISDIPSHFKGKLSGKSAYNWESKFWSSVPYMATWNGVGYHIATQPIDTTFAMHRRDTRVGRLISPSVRAYAPYAAVHVDWYYDSENLPADKVYYTNGQSGVNNW